MANIRNQNLSLLLEENEKLTDLIKTIKGKLNYTFRCLYYLQHDIDPEKPPADYKMEKYPDLMVFSYINVTHNPNYKYDYFRKTMEFDNYARDVPHEIFEGYYTNFLEHMEITIKKAHEKNIQQLLKSKTTRCQFQIPGCHEPDCFLDFETKKTTFCKINFTYDDIDPNSITLGNTYPIKYVPK